LKATAGQKQKQKRKQGEIKGASWQKLATKCGAATAAKIALNWRQPLNAIYQTDDRDSRTKHTQHNTGRVCGGQGAGERGCNS